MAECVKVIVRCRPMNARENGLDCKCCVTMDSARGACAIKNPDDPKCPAKMFTFDGAYFIDSTTEQIYNDIAYPLVEGVTEGYNGTIFAYGQTGCGKSFSMQGITDPVSQRGIIPRAFDHIFETVGVADGCKFLIHASYLEIYNEEIRDLLGKDVKHKMELKEHPEKGVYVAGLSMHPVHNVVDCNHIMEKGWKNRAVGATLMNADSSRSHSIFTIYMEMTNVDDAGEEHIRAGKLNLVDLAGSERQAKTGATGDRLKEATKINLSLSALGNVISALVDGKSKHIPYRDSKLTRLLQDSLGGNTKTMMVACLSPADNNYDETLSTLRYANRAKNIKNKPKINEDPKDALLRQYQEEILKLKAMLMGQIPVPKGGFDLSTPLHSDEDGSDMADDRLSREVEDTRQQLEEEKHRLREEYEQKMLDMQKEMELERTNRGKLQADMEKLRAFYDTKLKSVDGQLADLPPTAAVLAGEVDWDEEVNAHSERVKSKGERSKKTAGGVMAPLQPGVDSLAPASILPEDAMLIGPGVLEANASTEATVAEMPETVEDYNSKQEQANDDVTKPDTEIKGDLAPPEVIQGPDGLAVVRRLDEEAMVTAPEELEGEQGSAVPQAAASTATTGVKLQQKEALKRLQALQQQMVGGENVNNTELKEQHKRRKMHAEDQRKKKLVQANKKMDDDGIMVGIYEDIQEELKDQKAVVQSKEQMIESLQREIIDLQSEFEFDRIDYLDTIRKQERHIKLLDTLLERIQPCLRRDSNYYNLDRIRTECKWDEEAEKWVIPKMVVEKTALPNSSSSTVLPTKGPGRGGPSMNGDGDDRGHQDEDFSDERLRERLRKSGDISNSYFAPKRQNQLIAEPVNRSNLKDVRETFGITSQQPLASNGFHEESMSSGLRAAHVHGQLMSDELVRRPTRLDSLPALGPVGGKKGKKKRGSTEPF